MDTIDWVAWHSRYDDPDDMLRQRLEIVTGHIVEALERIDRSPVRIISMCSGQARDLRGALTRAIRRDLTGRLVEVDPGLVDEARIGLHGQGATGLEVALGDAGSLSAYRGAAPADLVLVCGVFGNISDADIERTVRALPQLCAPDATVVWTRHRRPPDLTVAIRRWLAELDFENTAFGTIPDADRQGAVGVARFHGDAQPLGEGHLFTFTRTEL
jgi:hypothetical protein